MAYSMQEMEDEVEECFSGEREWTCRLIFDMDKYAATV